jgi:hypothetical protein
MFHAKKGMRDDYVTPSELIFRFFEITQLLLIII